MNRRISNLTDMIFVLLAANGLAKLSFNAV